MQENDAANKPDASQLPPENTVYPMMFGFAYRYRKPSGEWAIKFLFGKFLALFAAVFIVLLVFKSAFVYSFYKYKRGYDEITVPQAVIFPLNRVKTAKALGDYNIRKAKALIEQSSAEHNYYKEAFETLLNGVARSRDNIEGKKLLSQFFLLMRRSDNAIETLESGIHNPEAYEDIAYVRIYLQLLISNIEDKKLMDVCNAILAQNPKSEEVKSYVAMALATVYSMHGRYAESKKIIDGYGLADKTPGILRLSKNEWEQGNRDAAIEIITSNIHKIDDLDPVYALLVNYYIIMNDYAKARRYGALRVAANSKSVVPKIDYLRSLANSGDKAYADAEIDRLFKLYSSDEKAMLHISNYAADNGNIELMRRIYNNAIVNGFKPAPFCMLLLETFITAKDYAAAVKFSEDIIAENPKWLDKNEDIFLCLRAVAYYAKGDIHTAQVLVREITRSARANPHTLAATARRFAILGEKSIANSLYIAAVEKDPKHQYALVKLIVFELESGNSTDLDKYILRLLNMRRPPRDMILSTRKSLLSDRFIFTKERERIISAIDAALDLEKISGNRIFSDLPSGYEDEKVLSSFD
ncbi:MAG: hypothetical protein J6P03_08485 [Opitutales bacterium]|nr:hypothetical protein [Opitutales bacterium]